MKKHIQTVIRMEKIKSFLELKNKHKHNMRLIDVPNSDKSNDIAVLFGTKDLISDVRKFLERKEINVNKLRKDAVIATEIVVSLSPTFFKTDKLDFKGKFNKKCTEKFIEIANRHIKEKFMDNAVAAYLHLDESTPHIHYFIIPVVSDSCDKLSYRLSCKDFFNKLSLINLQADYCRSFNDVLGDEYFFEYKKNGKAKHKTLNQFYKNINQTKEIIEGKDAEIISLNSEIVLNKFLYDSKVKSLELNISSLEIEIENYKSILYSIKNTIKRFFIDKLSLFDFDVLEFFKFMKDENDLDEDYEKLDNYKDVKNGHKDIKVKFKE